MRVLLNAGMRARQRLDRTVQIDERRMSIGFRVVENAVDARLLCQDIRWSIAVDHRWGEMRLPLRQSDFDGLGSALELRA